MDCAALYQAARRAYEQGDQQQAGQLFQAFIDTYPGTHEAEYAASHIETMAVKGSGDNGTAEQREDLGLVFHGSAREYFRVWIVNLCLTLLTVGLFSAWAKVRKKRYFYANLTLDNTPFQYVARPIPILKGRVVAAVLFMTYYASSHVFTALLPYVLGAGAVLAPWVLVRSAAFNARYSAYRNMTFSFDGTYGEAARVLGAWGIVPALVIGTMFGWWGHPWAAGLVSALFGLHFPWWVCRLKRFLVTNLSYGGRYGQFGATGGQFFKVYFTASLIMVGFGIVFGLAGASFVWVLRDAPYVSVLFAIPVYAGYVPAFAYVQANITNTVWNRARIGPVRFKSDLKGRDMAKLYVTNALGIAASAGLLIPWAAIRTFRYRIEHTNVVPEGGLDSFRGGDAVAVRAAGAEIGDFFDMDLSL